MPSIGDMLIQSNQMRLNNQTALITVPPIQKYAYFSDSATDALTNVIEPDPNKIIIINTIVLQVTNTAVTNAASVSLNWTDFWTGKPVDVQKSITPAVAGTESIVLTGINIPCMPGQPVTIWCSGGAPSNRHARVVYTEVPI